MSIHVNRRQFLATTAAASLVSAMPASFRAQEKSVSKRRIFAAGGGIFSAGNLLLMEYLLALTGKKDPIIYFLPTAEKKPR